MAQTFPSETCTSEQTLDLLERRTMKAHEQNINNKEYKERSRAIRIACRKDRQQFLEDKINAQQFMDCVGTRQRVNCTRTKTLSQRVTSIFNVIK